MQKVKMTFNIGINVNVPLISFLELIYNNLILWADLGDYTKQLFYSLRLGMNRMFPGNHWTLLFLKTHE